jgi:Short C-terminal domain
MIEAAHRPVDTGSGKVGIAGASVADELKKLVELRDVGALSDEEFAALKARLLSI